MLPMGMAEKLSIGFLGAGKMGTALARGFISAGLVTAGRILAFYRAQLVGGGYVAIQIPELSPTTTVS